MKHVLLVCRENLLKLVPAHNSHLSLTLILIALAILAL